MAAYVIADTHITDHKTYDEYKRQVGPLIAKFGGRFLVRVENTQCSKEAGNRAGWWS